MKGFNEIRNWYNSKTLETLEKNLEKRGFNTVSVQSKNEIHELVSEMIPSDKTVGLGGSVTLRELELDTVLAKRGNTLFNHWEPDLSFEDSVIIRKNQQHADFFLTSINAITRDGQLVNIDGVGNRVSSMIFGPGHVMAFVGINKIVRDVHEALDRIKNVTSPKNSKRLGMKTPCAKTGHCAECSGEVSACRVTTIIDFRPALTPFTVVLISDEFGF